jgi:GT2 family glycosyltransferase
MSDVGFQAVYGVPRTPAPKVSVVTTVYDRTECLQRCIRSVARSHYRDLEHLVVSDHPPLEALGEILRIVRRENAGQLRYVDLIERANDWGITPAGVGLRQSLGEFVCFLSDDNAFLPDHIGNLVEALERDVTLGFAYSSCLYANRVVLRVAPPTFRRIDLGQPLFRRSALTEHLHDELPFDAFTWDWAMIDTLLQAGVRWAHVDQATFVFRTSAYPQLVEALA